MVLTRMVTDFGDTAIAVQKVGSQIESVAWMTADGFAAAINSFIGQNFGAGKTERVKGGYKKAAWIMAAWGLGSSALLIFGAEPVFRIFIHEPEMWIRDSHRPPSLHHPECRRDHRHRRPGHRCV